MADIVLECNPDETLIKSLGYNRKEITHQPGKSGVIIYLENNPNAIGVVDEDPGTANPSYFQKFQIQGKEAFGIDYFLIPRKGTRLLIIKPRLEDWILKHAVEVNLNPEKFSLPNNGHALHKIINDHLPKFQELLDEMLRKKSKGLQHLRSLIEG